MFQSNGMHEISAFLGSMYSPRLGEMDNIRREDPLHSCLHRSKVS